MITVERHAVARRWRRARVTSTKVTVSVRDGVSAGGRIAPRHRDHGRMADRLIGAAVDVLMDGAATDSQQPP